MTARQFFDSLPEYDSDESAILDGRAIGFLYLTSDNHVSMPGGCLKKVR